MFNNYIYLDKINPHQELYHGSLTLGLYQAIWCIAIYYISNFNTIPLIIMCNGLNYHLAPNTVSRFIDIIFNGLVVLYFNVVHGNSIIYLLSFYLIIFYLFSIVVNATQKMRTQINYHLVTVQTIGFITLACALC
jgi:hypothetical protein